MRQNRVSITLLVSVISSWSADLEQFEKVIRPALVGHCVECHGPEKQKGGLRLDSRAGWMTGGDSGPAIIPGKPDESLLFRAISYERADTEMPPKGRLPEDLIRGFRQWILSGAPDPREGVAIAHRDESPTLAEGRRFWSFQPVNPPAVPKVQNAGWTRTKSDHFVLKRLEQAGLTPAAEAPPETLVRRIYYDLVGLPPTPEELQSVCSDWSDARYAALVDRLLASEQFGERWGRHWLDVARFAESSGGGRTLLFPDAWRYRDYVIDAFNQDLPYDQFVREQLAGDLLPTDDWRERGRRLTATAFLLLGPTNYELQDKDVLEMDIIDEQLDILGKAFMGMTIGCARCHDHKFDPISARDYYGMAGIFKSTRSVVHSNVSRWSEADLPLPPDEVATHATRSAELDDLRRRIGQLEAGIKRLGGDRRKTTRRSKGIPIGSLPGTVVDDSEAVLEGDWTVSTFSNSYVGDGYAHDANSDKGAKLATFIPALPQPGLYEVQLAWTAFPNRATEVPVTVHHAGGVERIIVNQREPGPIEGHRLSLGRFEFQPDANARVVVSNEDAVDGVVIADAVLFIPLRTGTATAVPPLPRPEEVDDPALIPFIVPDPLALEGIVVDDTQALRVGEWKQSVHTPPFVGAGYLHDLKEAKGAKSITFRPELPRGGTYEVRVSHNTNVRRSTNAPVTIRHADGETTLRINEGEEAPINRLFRSLGEFRFEAGTNGSVTFTTTGTDGKYVIVDAVQFIHRPVDTEDRARLARMKEELEELQSRAAAVEKQLSRRPRAMAVQEAETIGDIPLAIRGVTHNHGPIIPRGVMPVATLGNAPMIPKDASGRREFADWLTSSRHPLTARVMVNRVWHWLFGRGIVPSVDNFGMKGRPPTHPELLDHLAAAFVADGWSTKSLIRRLALSSTYRMGGANAVGHALVADPENRLLWHRERRRLDAEAIRDSLLQIAGELDPTRGGNNIRPGTKIEYGYRFESTRRSVYVPVFRNTLPEIFATFDFADPNIQVGRRSTSTIAPQALLFLNSPFVIGRAEKAAERLLDRAGLSDDERIRRVHLETLGREPSEGELAASRRFIGEGAPPERWALLYQTLFATIDFRYLD